MQRDPAVRRRATRAAALLARHNAALLIDESAPAPVRHRLRDLVAAEAWLAEVPDLVAVRMGPNQLLVIAHVVPHDGVDVVTAISQLRSDLLALPVVVQVEVTPVPGRPA